MIGHKLQVRTDYYGRGIQKQKGGVLIKRKQKSTSSG